MASVWLLAVLFWASGSATAFSAMDPEEIKEIKDAAPLHLQGEVIKDKLIREIDFPGQERMMSIRISEIHKGTQFAEPDNTIDVSYTYIPAWLEAEGGAKMDIGVSDRIEIWLKVENGIWMPAASGDTVTYLFKNEERPEHLPQPFPTKTFRHIEIPLFAAVALILGFTLGMTAFLSGRLRSFGR